MLVNTSRISPRSKEWIPLATQQLRLRNLIQILAFNMDNSSEHVLDKKPKNNTKVSYYYTLHSTMMSAPFYTSEKIESENPKWNEVEVSDFRNNVKGSEPAVVLRIWSSNTNEQAVVVLGIYFNGLTYLGPRLNLAVSALSLGPNAVVFCFPAGYFTYPKCLPSSPQSRFISSLVSTNDVRPSYNVKLLSRLHNLQQVIYKQSATAEQLKEKISVGSFIGSESRADTMLRKLMSKSKPKVLRQDIVSVKKKVEEAKFRNNLLKEERKYTLQKLDRLKKKLSMLCDDNIDKESTLMEYNSLLGREVKTFKEWKQGHVGRREIQLNARGMLNSRSLDLITELGLIYPIKEKSVGKYTISEVHLPNSEELAGHDDLQLSVALGYVAHVVQMISVFLQVPLRYPVVHYGSRSSIIDDISNELQEREFPLHSMSRDKLHFNYGVFLLNKNIAQLRWCFGYSTSDLRNTLYNLSFFVCPKPEQRSLSLSCSQLSSPTLHSTLSSSPHFQFHHELDQPNLVPLFTHPLGSKPRSSGSAKDLSRHRLDPKFRPHSMSNNLSYSLDKGLNEYRELGREELSQKKEILTSSTCNLENIFPGVLIDRCKLPEGLAIDKNKDIEIFLKSQEENIKSWLQSDELQNHSIGEPLHEENIQSSSPIVNDSSKKEIDDVPLIDESIVTDNDKNLRLTDENSTEETTGVDSKELQFVIDFKPSNKESFNSGSNNESEPQVLQRDIAEVNVAARDSVVVENIKEDENVFSDTLLANVTSRTEALANQPTTFNRFRSRFGSTLEGSN